MESRRNAKGVSKSERKAHNVHYVHGLHGAVWHGCTVLRACGVDVAREVCGMALRRRPASVGCRYRVQRGIRRTVNNKAGNAPAYPLGGCYVD